MISFIGMRGNCRIALDETELHRFEVANAHLTVIDIDSIMAVCMVIQCACSVRSPSGSKDDKYAGHLEDRLNIN